MKQIIPPLFQISSSIAPSWTAHVAQELFLKPRRLPFSTKEEALLKESRREILQSGRVVYFWGDVDRPTVAVIHGWESRASAFFKWIPLFLDSGFSVMGWDAPAHGQSPGESTTAPEMARAFAEDLNELRLQLHGIVAHSMGGVVLGILPQLGVRVSKTVIVSSPSHIQGVCDRYHNQIRLQPKAREIFTRRLEKRAGMNFNDGSLANNDMSLVSDALVMHDLEDREVPFSDFQELQKRWKKAKFVATNGLGHRRILRDESVGYQIAEFLKASSRSSF